MDSEGVCEMPLCLDNAGCVLTPLSDKMDEERNNSDISSISSNSLLGHSCLELTASESQETESSRKRGQDVPSTSVTSAKEECVPVAVKKKVKKGKYYCYVCEADLSAGDYRSHHIGKQHRKKGVPKLKPKFSITVLNLNSDVTEGVLYDYFSVVGAVQTVFIYRGEVSYAVVEFVYKCCVDHAAECLSAHILKDSKLVVNKGLPYGKKVLNSHLGITSSSSGKVSSPKKCDPVTEMKKETCNVCNVLLDTDNSREHYLSREHTEKAYSTIKAKCCVNVTGFPPDTDVKALYDYFSLPGRVITLVIFRRQKTCALVEFSQRCSVAHAVKCLVPHVFGNSILTVCSGLPLGGTLPKMPDFLCGNEVPLVKSIAEKCGSTQRKAIQKKEIQEKGTEGNEKGRALSDCHICHATFRAGRRRRHYLSENHIAKAIPLMRESSCITVSGFPAQTTMEVLYDYFSNFERVRTIDTRRQKKGLVVVEFESKHPLPNVLECITIQVIGNITLTVIRGCPSPEIPVQNPVSHKKEECLQVKCKPIDHGAKSHPMSSVGSIPDRVIKSEFENAMKSLQIKEPVVGTVVENHVVSNANNSNTNSGIKKEVETKPLMCDACNVFYNPELFRAHHISKKHNKKALQFMNEKCCILVKGFFKDTKLHTLYDYFSQCGKVKAIVIHKKKELLAVVEFYDVNSALAVLKTGKSHMLKNRKLIVQHGQPSYNGGIPLETLPPHSTLMSSLQKCNAVHDQMLCLQSSLLLSEKNRKARIDLCDLLKSVLIPFFPYCALHLFGSSVNSFGLRGSDVDMLFEVRSDKPNKVEQESNYPKPEIKSPSVTDVIADRFPAAHLASLPRVFQLDFIKKVLRKYPHEFHTVVLVPSAACPIVKFISKRYGLSCDISNGNRLSLCNTGLLHVYGRLDKRVIPLVTTLRYWAKKFNYINPRSFSSYAFTLLVIFFLQTREPSVLPSVNFLRSRADRKIMVDSFDCSFCSDSEKIEPSRNCQTLVNLLWEFFAYYEKFDFSKFVISPLTGCCEPVELFSSNTKSSTIGFKVSPVCIQDPFLTSRNVSSFVQKETLERMTDHLHKISREQHYNYIHKNEKAKTNPCSTKWGIPQLFDVMPKQVKTKVPKKRQGVISWAMVKIPLNKEIVDHVQKKYDISCTQCVNLTEIALHEICCFVIDLMHQVLLLDVEITADLKNHREWKAKVQTMHCSCSCRDPCNNNLNVNNDVQSEKLEGKFCEMKNTSCSANLNGSSIGGVLDEELTRNLLETNDSSCSDDSSSEDSSAGCISDEESSPETVKTKMPDELPAAQDILPEEGSSKCFDVKDQEPFLCIKLTAVYQTWVCRNKYKKQCNRNAFESTLEFENCISQKISKDRTLEIESPAKFKCEFYYHHKGTESFLFLKVIPPEFKRCWKPLISFLKVYLAKMVKSSLCC